MTNRMSAHDALQYANTFLLQYARELEAYPPDGATNARLPSNTVINLKRASVVIRKMIACHEEIDALIDDEVIK